MFYFEAILSIRTYTLLDNVRIQFPIFLQTTERWNVSNEFSDDGHLLRNMPRNMPK